MDTLTLIKQAHLGDKDSRDKILMENTGLIWSIVRRFLNRGYDKEDLFQIGCIGMLKAIDRFDTEYNVAFSTYAVPLITGEIRRFLRDDGIIKISRTIKENQNKVIAETEKFREKYNKEPTIEQLSKACGLDKEDVVTAIESLKDVESIDKDSENSSGGSVSIIEKIEDKNNNEDIVLDRMLIKQLLSTLDETDQKIIVLRYFQNKTQAQIAEIIGKTQVQVSRMEKKILLNLKKQIFYEKGNIR